MNVNKNKSINQISVDLSIYSFQGMNSFELELILKIEIQYQIWNHHYLLQYG